MKATGTDSVLVMGEALVDLVIRAGSDSSNVTAVPGGSVAVQETRPQSVWLYRELCVTVHPPKRVVELRDTMPVMSL